LDKKRDEVGKPTPLSLSPFLVPTNMLLVISKHGVFGFLDPTQKNIGKTTTLW